MGKGKMRDVASSRPQTPPFILPSVVDACQETANLWPERITPSYWIAPWPPERRSSIPLGLNADNACQMGSLVVKLVGWMVNPSFIDLTIDEPVPSFEPPAGTTVTPAGDQLPRDLSLLIGEETRFSMCVRAALSKNFPCVYIWISPAAKP